VAQEKIVNIINLIDIIIVLMQVFFTRTILLLMAAVPSLGLYTINKINKVKPYKGG